MLRLLATAILGFYFVADTALAQRAERSDIDRSEQRGDNRIRLRNDRRASEEAPLTPGFGETIDLPAVPGFGVDLDNVGVRQAGVPITDRYHEKIVAYADQVLRRYDQNGSGKLEREEWNSARWRSDPAVSDLNRDGVLTRDELCERVKAYDEFRGLSSPSESLGVSQRSSGSQRARLEEYARGLIRRYDHNENGVLEEKEYGEMSSFHRGADANGDRVITREELADRLANYGNSSSSPGREDSDRDHSPNDSTGGRPYRSAGTSPAYRARSLAERLPQGLPEWFIRNDTNGDGQIAMAEYAVTWTDEKLEEFIQQDANGDGLITPRECLSERPAGKDSPPAERPRFGRSWGR
jgi:Ca2+-binding EF-hand superfamily protein